MPDHIEPSGTIIQHPHPASLPGSTLVPNVRGVSDESWGLAARAIALGTPLEQVARSLNIGRTTLWRALRGSPALRNLIQQERQVEQTRLAAELDLLCADALACLREALRNGNVRAAIWLLERRDVAKWDVDQTDPARTAPATAGNAPAHPPGMSDPDTVGIIDLARLEARYAGPATPTGGPSIHPAYTG